MNLMFNLGKAEDQHILILKDEFGTIEAHTFQRKDLYDAEIDMAQEFGKTILFNQEAKQD